jgi:ABC-2 type transport system permease protein
MIPLSGYIIMAFSCMIFAGEFDRGTIKNLLTRPVTRTNLYVAKVITATVIATMLFLVVVWSSAAFGLVKGELGAIWADQSFQIRSTFMEMMSHTMLAVMMSFLSILCLVMLGVVISNVINNSGYAVAAGLILMLILSIASGMARENARPYFFNYYIGYSFETLRNFALGSATARWDPKIMEHALFGQTGSFRVPLYLIVPLTYSLVLIGISYIIFKFKQVIA